MLGRWDRDKYNLGIIDPFLDAVGKTQPLGGHVPVDYLLEPWLINRDLSRLQRLDFARVIVDTKDVVANISKAGAGDQPDITGTDDRDIHNILEIATP